LWRRSAVKSSEKPRGGVKGDSQIIQGAYCDALKLLKQFDELANKDMWESLEKVYDT
jgi:hypothetical protein